ncbi:protein kinase [Streptomyces sp. AC550_RSS872]|uniref:protein kinase n=1 Tax=Streptomyces sp. AC550_RSS872 TaxID=2823689 RepID=UPI001C259560|nr:protein kinase [Streptomyces sp. AC550_RSS872]
MDDYAGRVLADRYRLPLPPSDEYELTETRAFDTYSGQEVLVRQVPLPEVVEAEVLDAEGLPDGFTARETRERGAGRRSPSRVSTRRPSEPAVRRAVEAAQAAARIPDHPRLDQVFDVFAEGGSLWIVSEFVAARPLAALLAEKPLTPYRAAEVASDVLMALRVLHAHGWVHRNITARTVLVCDDGRVMLTGLAVGAAEEALCGYDPVPVEDGDGSGGGGGASGTFGGGPGGAGGLVPPGSRAGETAIGGPGVAGADPEAARRAAIEARAAGALPVPGADAGTGTGTGTEAPGGALETGGDIRAARAGAIAAYRAGARAAARVQETQQNGRAALPGARPAPEDGPAALADGAAQQPYGSGGGTATPPGRIADPYGVQAPSWPGAAPRSGAPGAPTDDGRGRTALPAAGPDAGGPMAGGITAASREAFPTGVPAPGAGGSPTPGVSVPGAGGLPPHGVPGQGGLGSPVPGAGGISVPGGTVPGAGGLPPHGVPGQGGLGSPAPGAGGVPVPGGTVPGAGGLPGQGVPGQGVPAQGAHGFSAQGAPGSSARGVTAGGPASHPPARWDDLVTGTPAHRGPTTALAAERARQARMAVVGPVTERWAPEQAGPVHENWQLAAPIGPATDLWALGALLFRAVQGHAPYPEESTAELVQMVCAEPPAFAEECGPLRPVVESLLRQDPTERLDFEELRGWLRSLVRSAPEPEAGTHVVAAPPVDPNRLPIVRRRGELVRRRRAGLPAHHGRHKRARREAEHSPRRLGRTLLVLVLLGMAAAIAYAMLFMPKADQGDGAPADAGRSGAAGRADGAEPEQSAEASSEPRPEQTSPGSGNDPSESAGSTETQTNSPDDPDVPDGFTLRKDTAGFQIAVANGWNRTPENGSGQVVYSHGDFDLVVVAGRDTADQYGSDPMVYQREHERELQPYRDSSWASSGGLKTIQVGERVMAEGQFTWTDDQGRELFVRNVAILVDGRYHVVQVRGPEAERDEVTRLFEQASATYQVTG